MVKKAELWEYEETSHTVCMQQVETSTLVLGWLLFYPILFSLGLCGRNQSGPSLLPSPSPEMH